MTASTPERLPVITRPNGKLYRPRKIVTHSWDNEAEATGFGCGALVLGTHDVDRAQPLAAQACDAWHGVRYAIRPEIGWFRNGFQSGHRVWLRDEVRGAAGVMFTAADDPEETP